MAILLCHVVTVQDIQNNRPQVYALLRSVLNESHRDSAPRALHVLSLHSQLLSHFYFRYKLYVIFKKIPCGLQHLPEAVLYGCDIFMVGHAVPGVIGLQNLHGHLAFTQQFPNENRDQILCSQRIFRYFRLEELFEALLQDIQEIRCQPPLFGLKTPIYQKSHVNYSELLQLAKGWSNLVSNRIIIWRLQIRSIIFSLIVL